jgi:hypothetical protein
MELGLHSSGKPLATALATTKYPVSHDADKRMTNKRVKKMKAFNSRIDLRLSDKERERAQQLLLERKFSSLSQLVRTAIKDLLEKYEETE